jgi:hypothetical protein
MTTPFVVMRLAANNDQRPLYCRHRTERLAAQLPVARASGLSTAKAIVHRGGRRSTAAGGEALAGHPCLSCVNHLSKLTQQWLHFGTARSGSPDLLPLPTRLPPDCSVISGFLSV